MWYNKLYLITLELPCLETFLTEGSKECALSEFIHLIGIPRKPVFRLTFLLVHFSFLLQLPCKTSVMNFCWKDLELYILSGVWIPFCFLDFFHRLNLRSQLYLLFYSIGTELFSY